MQEEQDKGLQDEDDGEEEDDDCCCSVCGGKRWRVAWIDPSDWQGRELPCHEGAYHGPCEAPPVIPVGG